MIQQSLLDWKPPVPTDIRGDTFDSDRDGARLNAQQKQVYDAAICGDWFTLARLSELTGAPEASVSARLRDFRRFGMKVERRYIGSGLNEYRLTH